jgi:hypothetical protein
MSAAAIDPFVLRQAEIRASRIVGATGYTPDDWEDLRQELLLDYVSRQPKFDPARGDQRSFVFGVLRNHAAKLAKAGSRARAASELTEDATDPCVCASTDLEAELHLRIDVQTVLARLPEHLRILAVQLTEMSPGRGVPGVGPIAFLHLPLDRRTPPRVHLGWAHSGRSGPPGRSTVNKQQTIVEMPCEEIRIGERHRKDLGELEVRRQYLYGRHSRSARGHQGRRARLRRTPVPGDARHPGWKTIPVIVLEVSSIVEGEYAENEIRKDFTPSERVAIGKAIEAEIGKRQGRRSDLGLPLNCAEVASGMETRQVAAAKAGVSTARTSMSGPRRLSRKPSKKWLPRWMPAICRSAPPR